MIGLAHALSYSLLVSPMLFVVTALIGAGAAVHWRRAGLVVAIASLLTLAALATPYAASHLINMTESGLPAAESGAGNAGAIVILGGDVQPSESAQHDGLGLLSLERVYLGAREYRAAGLPILVAGGVVLLGNPPIADLMADVLEHDFAIPARWRETRSTNTYENAEFSAEILARENVSVIIVVTQRWHMKRAIWAFRRFGITALPAPAPPNRLIPGDQFGAWVPSVSALSDSYFAIHEILGLVFYRLAPG
jgi:uncharacterized SAM-binding protein YcdF (DUF218 family)